MAPNLFITAFTNASLSVVFKIKLARIFTMMIKISRTTKRMIRNEQFTYGKRIGTQLLRDSFLALSWDKVFFPTRICSKSVSILPVPSVL